MGMERLLTSICKYIAHHKFTVAPPCAVICGKQINLFILLFHPVYSSQQGFNRFIAK